MLETIRQPLSSDGKKCRPRILNSGKTLFKKDGEIKTMPVKQKLRELIASNILRRLKGFLQAEGQYCWTEKTITREIHCPQKRTVWDTKDHQAMACEPNPAC